MTRKFKMVGVLMAVVAMFAVTASAAQANFTSANYPASASGTSTKDVFDAFGSTVTCTNNAFSSNTLAGPSETLTVTPTYKSCTAFGLPATVNFTGCDYLFKKPNGVAGTVDVVCAAGKAIDINVYSDASHSSAICHVTVPGQTGKSGYTLANSGSNVVISGSVSGLNASQSRTSIFCPAGTSTTSSIYTIQAGGITMTGNNGAISVD